MRASRFPNTFSSLIFDYPGIDPYNSTSHSVKLPPGNVETEDRLSGETPIGNASRYGHSDIYQYLCETSH